MNGTFVKCLISGVIGFVIGGGTGYLVRKKTTEVKFDICSDEELEAMMAADNAANREQEESNNEIPEITRPIDIQKAIDHTFENDGSQGIRVVDTQKEQYFQKWKAEEVSKRYDTRSSEVESEDLDGDEDFDEDFIKDIQEDEDAPAPVMVNAANIEPATIEDWDHWAGIQDGKYDAIHLNWYDEDDVVTDDNNEPIENQERYVGTDVMSYFNKIPDTTTDDPDVRVIFNHKYKVIYQIARLHQNYSQKKKMEEYGGDDDDIDDRDDWIRSRNE